MTAVISLYLLRRSVYSYIPEKTNIRHAHILYRRSNFLDMATTESNEALAQQLAERLARQSSQIGEGVKKWRDPSFFQKLRSAASLSSVHSTMSDSYDYDDLFLLYKDPDGISFALLHTSY